MLIRFAVLFAAFSLGPVFTVPALAQSEFVGESAVRLFYSILTPETRYSSADHTYVVFVKEADALKCSAFTLGDANEPTLSMTYRCETKASGTGISF